MKMSTFILSAIGVFFLVMVLTRSCFYSPNQPLLRQTGKEIGESGYYYGYGIFRNNIYWWSGNKYKLDDVPRKLEKVDRKTFTVLDGVLGKDKYAIYFMEVRNTNVDVETFEAKNDVYRDKNYVYRYGNSRENQSFAIVPDADPVSFQSLGNHWAKDNRYVYLHYNKFDADPQTFVNINEQYSKDKDYLYYMYLKNSALRADKEKCNTDELTLINHRYIRTNTRIYHLSTENVFTAIHLKDTASIEILPHSLWLKADGQIVFCGLWLNNPDIDDSTFSSLGMQFFKDKNHVYFWQWHETYPNLIIIKDADLDTFESVSEYDHYAKDRNHVYYKDKILTGADPNDFRYDKEKLKAYSGKNVYEYGELKVAKNR